MKIIIVVFRTSVITVVLAVFSFNSFALALTQKQLDLLNSGSYYYDYGGDCSSNDSGYTGGTSNLPTGPWSYKSNAQQPYYEEQFVIDLLKDIAQVKGVPESSTVTQEHVIAMIAWQLQEGGNTHNTGNDFNLWNMGYLSSFPQLFTHGTSDGSQTGFVSYDAGIEGNTIEMTGSLQGRIGTVLSNPGSSAADVLKAISYPDLTPGNLAWAWGNKKTEAAAAEYDHTNYYPSLLNDLASTRSNYSTYATVVIGPADRGTNSPRVSSSLLTYNGGSGSNDPQPSTANGQSNSSSCGANSSTSVSCTDGSKSNILCEAQKYKGIYYQWGGGHSGYSNFRTNCPESAISGAAAQSTTSHPGPCSTDCSGLVTVAVDAVYNQTFSFSVGSDGKISGGSNGTWIPVREKDVQPGDIATEIGHVEIVDHYDSSTNTLYTFGSHATGTQTGAASSQGTTQFTKFFKYNGPGA
jgi:hypothetical protein